MTIDIEKIAATCEGNPRVRVASISVPSRRTSTDNTRSVQVQSCKFSVNETDIMGLDGNSGTCESLGCMYERIWSVKALLRWARHFVPVAALLGVPVALLATIYAESRAAGVRLLGLFVWLEVVWGSLWISKLIAMLMPTAYVFLCGIVNSGTRKYHTVLRGIETSISLMFWTIIAYATVVPVCMAFDSNIPTPDWVSILQKVALASIAVAAMVLVQRFVIQLINITYSAKQFTTRISESKRQIAMLDTLYASSTRMYPPFCDRFAQEDYTIITGEVEQKDSSPSKLLANVRLAGREVAQAFGQMTADISGNNSLFNTQAAHTIVTEALEAAASSAALARRIWKSFAPLTGDALTQKDLEKAFTADRIRDVEELFALLDVDQNGDVSLEEMISTVIRIGQERISIWKSTHDIKSAVLVLDRFLQVFILIGTGLIYAAFFSNSFSTYIASIGTQLAAVSFAISGTVQEFLGSCIFIFVKHPFDVGDRVIIDGHELTVEKISLLYSVFQKVGSNKTTQVPNINLNSMWVDNVSRSRGLRERIKVQIAADTSFDDVENLRRRIRDEISAPENRRDFRPDVDVELVSIGDMSKLEVYVEAEHKSNWNNEKTRRIRRNKLMTSVVGSLRAVSIHGPGGGSATLGDPARSTYQVVVSEEVAAAAARDSQHEKSALKSVSPVSGSNDDDQESFTGMTRRR
ncbi:putative MscS family protein [Colletotrichum gloeosporioides]|uniref:Mechanosensitive ion channel protein n=1 Tax=Colletotrichum gloeosporioides TaxID=474922 RepID=A0A8H4FI73_COLGL|nr:putative MscS family protein [Colletotrichum gloeosporioides]KAF3802776.1 putative MscS family protein [Colletotrichum gloeosporioides]